MFQRIYVLILLFISVLAASGAGSSAERSTTTMFLYPRFKRWYAVEIPKHPAPTMTKEGELAMLQ
jgi:hypothetical protein